MIRSQVKAFGVLSLTLAALIVSASMAFAADILEFIDIPVSNHQAAVEPILACRNGFMFGFHALDTLAQREDGPRQWDISIAKDDDNLLITEYPLWLGETKTPLLRNGVPYSYAGTYTLLWNETVPITPLIACYSGARSGFCNTVVEIDDCLINPWLVIDIAQIGPQNGTRIVTDSLVFEVRAYDPDVGTNNGDGIAQVTMQVIDPVNGSAVYTAEHDASVLPEAGVQYCALSPDCAPWVFSQHNATWPNGAPVENGTYWLRAMVSTPDNTRKVVQTEIQIDAPPNIRTVHIPAGDFSMGSDANSGVEGPVHSVAVGDFWIMRNEVTNRQYAQCVKAGVCSAPQNGERWRDPAFADHPVAGVSWEQANTFAAWVGGRLPTEAEWEKACRGTDGRIYPWGNVAATHEVANYDNVLADTVPVGSYSGSASPYGVLDMSGNVWEWTSSLYADYPYVADDGREDSSATGRRVARGGSYYYTHYQLTCSFRAPMEPDDANTQMGMRVVFDRPVNPEGVRFVAPVDGAVVTSPFTVEMVAKGITIEPAGEIHENAGHFHIMIDTDFVGPDELIPFDENHLHFGQGQLTTTLELEPGIHVLRLQVADGAHLALDGDQYRDEISVIVRAGQ